MNGAFVDCVEWQSILAQGHTLINQMGKSCAFVDFAEWQSLMGQGHTLINQMGQSS